MRNIGRDGLTLIRKKTIPCYLFCSSESSGMPPSQRVTGKKNVVSLPGAITADKESHPLTLMFDMESSIPKVIKKPPKNWAFSDGVYQNYSPVTKPIEKKQGNVNYGVLKKIIFDKKYIHKPL